VSSTPRSRRRCRSATMTSSSRAATTRARQTRSRYRSAQAQLDPRLVVGAYLHLLRGDAEPALLRRHPHAPRRCALDAEVAVTIGAPAQPGDRDQRVAHRIAAVVAYGPRDDAAALHLDVHIAHRHVV